MSSIGKTDASVEPGPSAESGGSDAPDRVELALDRLIGDWELAYRRVLQYTARLGFTETTRRALARQSVRNAAVAADAPAQEPSPVTSSFAALRRILVGGGGGKTDDPSFQRVCLERAGWAPRTDDAKPADELTLLATVPPTVRGHMAAATLKRWDGRRTKDTEKGQGRDTWKWASRWRRILFAALVVGQSVAATLYLIDLLPRKGDTAIEILIAALFATLFAWISVGLWYSVLGFWVTVIRGDKYRITRLLDGKTLPEIPQSVRTAIVMPVCNEPVERVYPALQAMYESVAKTGQRDRFDFFILSDTYDPAAALREEQAWARLCRAVDGYGRIFYRRRKVRIRRKTGNIAEFLRRWGTRYPYMIVLDADSIVSGETLVRLVALIERSPHAGLVQTRPQAIHRRSLFGRIHQFAGRIYGPMFAAGLHWWQLGDGQYWGHNAVIRTEAFMKTCGLPKLSGKAPLGGEILSHDFVEAALLGRSGWELWLAYDLEGTYEETPSSLLEEMKRDRRWCQGNLQHGRLIFARGLRWAHRSLFLNGIFSYASAVIWFAFVVVSTYQAVADVLFPVDYFPHGRSLFPEWPVWDPMKAMTLTGVTAVVLFVPKVLGVLYVIAKRQVRGFGGILRLVASVLLEIVFSTLMAPIRMVFHTRFVVLNLLGRTVAWKSAPRDDEETGWLEATRRHAVDAVIALAWGAALYRFDPSFFWWITPILGALVLSVPLSVLTSRVGLGDRVRKLGLFVIPEETAPPPILREFDTHWRAAREAAGPRDPDQVFAAALRDPEPWALHLAMMRRQPRCFSQGIIDSRYATAVRAATEGPAGLGPEERRILLEDARLVTFVHEGIWALPDGDSAERWGLA